MHDDHDHDQGAHPPAAGPGHNHPKAAVQWQVRHETHHHDQTPPAEQDLDLVETSFVEGFERATDPTSFLRLAGIPFVGEDAQGRRLHLLRVEMASLTDLGAVSPLLGGKQVRYDPLPSRLVSRRRQLAFVYHDGTATARLSFAEARRLSDETNAAAVGLGGS